MKNESRTFMANYFCETHNYVSEYRPEEPDIRCPQCRDQDLFTPEEIQQYENLWCRRVAVYFRRFAYPDTLLVVLRDTDTEDYARSICPQGSWRFESVVHCIPADMCTKNALWIKRPEDGKTLDDDAKSCKCAD